MSGGKGINDEEEDQCVGNYHGYPLLMKTDMDEEMATDVSSRYNLKNIIIRYIVKHVKNKLYNSDLDY